MAPGQSPSPVTGEHEEHPAAGWEVNICRALPAETPPTSIVAPQKNCSHTIASSDIINESLQNLYYSSLKVILYQTSVVIASTLSCPFCKDAFNQRHVSIYERI